MYSRTSDSDTTWIPSPQNIRGIPLEGHHLIRCRDERRRTVWLLYQHFPEVQVRGEWPSGLDKDPRRCQRVYRSVFQKRRGIPRRGENRKESGNAGIGQALSKQFLGEIRAATEPETVPILSRDRGEDVQNFHIVANDTIQVKWTYKKDCQPEDNKTNIYLVTFTTCWA